MDTQAATTAVVARRARGFGRHGRAGWLAVMLVFSGMGLLPFVIAGLVLWRG